MKFENEMNNSNLRTEFESLAVSTNKYLREVVKGMDIIILLRNMHPIAREHSAHILYNDKIITKDQAREFIKLM